MAIAKSVCGDCGAVLSAGDKFCPQCGSRIENNAAVEVLKTPVDPKTMRCGVCGKAVHADAVFCESCGASLQNENPPGSNVVQQSGRKQSPPQKKGKQQKPRFETWQIVTALVVLGLVVFFTYTELTREQPKQVMAAQQNFPASSAVAPEAIEQLQRTVDANPADDVSLLKLANMLHDASMSNASLLMRAVTTYSKYLQIKPNDPNARVDLGICYFEMARVDTNNAGSLLSKSLKEMQTAFDKNPTHQPAAFNLGIVNLNAGNLEESNKWLKKTVELNANSDLGQRAQRLLEQHSFQGSPN